MTGRDRVIAAVAVGLLLLVVGVVYVATLPESVCKARCAPSAYIEGPGRCICIDEPGRKHVPF